MFTSYQNGKIGFSSTTGAPEPCQLRATSRPRVCAMGSDGHWCSLIEYPPDTSPSSILDSPSRPARLNALKRIGPLVNA